MHSNNIASSSIFARSGGLGPRKQRGEIAMFAITGITGQVGGAIAHALLSAGHTVRAVVRDKAKATPWAERGAEIAIADFGDVAALTRAFSGTEGVFVMVPPNFAPDPGFAGAKD